MPHFEVTYQDQGEIHSTILEAAGPVEAERIFLAGQPSGTAVVLCVVRQSAPLPPQPGDRG